MPKEAVIYVGGEESLAEFESGLSEEAKADYKVVAYFRPAEGTVDDFRALLKAESVGRVIFVAKHTEFGYLAELVEACELQGIEAWISADFIRTQVARPDFDMLGGKPMLVLRSTPELSWALWMKEIMGPLGCLADHPVDFVALGHSGDRDHDHEPPGVGLLSTEAGG